MMVFLVEVTYTDRSRTHEGRFVERRTRVMVEANGPIDAKCVGVQFAMAHRPEDFMAIDSQVLV